MAVFEAGGRNGIARMIDLAIGSAEGSATRTRTDDNQISSLSSLTCLDELCVIRLRHLRGRYLATLNQELGS